MFWVLFVRELNLVCEISLTKAQVPVKCTSCFNTFHSIRMLNEKIWGTIRTPFFMDYKMQCKFRFGLMKTKTLWLEMTPRNSIFFLNLRIWIWFTFDHQISFNVHFLEDFLTLHFIFAILKQIQMKKLYRYTSEIPNQSQAVFHFFQMWILCTEQNVVSSS